MTQAEDDQFDRIMGGVAREASQRLEGLFPGLPERVDELAFQQLGKPLIINRDERKPDSRDQIAGIALPLQPDELRHIVIMKNGIICVVEPNLEGGITPEHMRNLYLDSFRIGSLEVKYPYFWDIRNVTENLLSRNSYFHNRVVLRNDNPNHLGGINQAIGEAMELSRRLKGQRDKAKEETATRALEEIDKLLNPPRTDQPNPGQ